MTRILLLGGYGGFGSRIAERLASAGWEVLVAGRSRDSAERFCAGRPNLVPLALDRDHGLAAALVHWRPFALVDAAGPFQGSSYEVARTCIARRCHYLDIADARAFVTGIAGLDPDARAAGVAVISGASTVPALSGAVVRDLARGMADITSVEIAISASNRATAGPSVTRAILSYVGKPVRLWRGGRWTIRPGWSELRREHFAVSGGAPLKGRLVALADVPDLDLLPDRVPGRPAVAFRAGTELAVENRGLWVLGWLVRQGWLARLDGLVPLLLRLQRAMSALGTDRSGMAVRVFGRVAGARIERRWTLVADNGVGPEIPGLAVPILLARLRNGSAVPGARDAGTLLSCADFVPAFADLAIRHEAVDVPQPPPLYARVLGARFDELPATIRTMHDILRDHGASGRADVRRGRHPLARMVAAVVGFPPEGEHDLHVAFAEQDGVETWTRTFSGHDFRSRLSQHGTMLVERFGPLRFGFNLAAGSSGLTMEIRRWWLGPLPLPLAWAPRSPAREWQADGRFCFDVPISLPLIGLVVRYVGWLK